ncbi:ABC transporter ATP-binding protein [Hazenella coriacea]|uniref:Putative ABC transport system ATP-binding protein/putative ABC transport system ATP-binding protein n=1 Tax=Hazenella coriacea TaxID=1179467 RepID=A0A4V2UVP7_9BACL|nr:ABC transporter ATP-binding protein [Hazenella coriacea]TCS96567.1 putative ABC transport system ATP-binding protein/putative ABC transport system ATP-binding protein [Hazenella coriacea]
MNVLEVKDVTKVYGHAQRGVVHQALDHVSLTVERGEFVGLMGPSGSGKTTLLQLMGTIDPPTSGEIIIEGQEVSKMNRDLLASFRRKTLGFIFQDFQLLDALSLKENILLPLVLEKRPLSEMEDRLQTLAQQLDILKFLDHRPFEVSGGQKQRAAAARALVHQPALILADEPTGNLDSKSSRSLMESLVRLNQTERATILMVTHDPITASYCDRVLFIKDGRIYNEVRRGEERQVFIQQLMNVMTALGGSQYDISLNRP